MLQLESTFAATPVKARPAPASVLVPAVARAVAVLELLEHTRQSMSLARLAANLAVPKSSLHSLCGTLKALGYLRRHEDGEFFLGPRVMRLATAFAAGTSPAREFMALVAEAAPAPHQTALLSVLEGVDVQCVALHHGVPALGLAYGVGTRWPAHRAATGRAMLAFQDEAQVKRLFPASRFPPFMNQPAMSRAELLRDLACTRESGYVVDDEGARQGVYCVAAPVFDAGGQVVAGLALCQQKGTLKARGAIRQREQTVRLARQLSQRLGAE